MCAMSGHRWCCTIQNMRRPCRWRRRCADEFASLRGATELPLPVVTEPARLIHRRIDAPQSATGRRQVKAGEAEQDRRRASIDERREHRLSGLDHVSEEISERYFVRQNELGY